MYVYVCSLEALIIQHLFGPVGAVLKELLLRLVYSLQKMDQLVS